MANVADILTDNIGIWASAIERRSTAGRGRSKKFSLYGIEKLRALILELAIRGKLVPQDPNEEAASELLRKIMRERDEQPASRRTSKAARTVKTATASPFTIPANWKWVKFGDIIVQHYGGGTPSKSNSNYWGGDILWASVKDVGKNKFIDDTEDRITESGLANSSSNLIDAGALIVVTRMGLGQLSINKVPMAINQDLRAIFPTRFADIDFIYNSFLTQQLEGAGLTVKGIRIEDLFNLPFPLPPLAEQHRIVAKVDDLMTLCDALEAETYSAIEAHELLVGNLLATLTRSQSADELAESWACIETHFDTLFTTEASINQLKQTILQLAVMGKIVQQDPSEDRTNQANLRPDGDAESYDHKSYATRKKKFSPPKGWTIEPLSRVSSHIVDCPHTTPKWTAEGYLCAKSEQVMPGYLDLTSLNYVSEETFLERIERLKPEPGDILFKREGGILGVACRIPHGTELCLGQRLMLIRSNSAILAEFLELVLNSPWTTDYAQEMTTGGAAPRVNMAIVRGFPIPLPPISEQQRILRKVSELTALCDSLKSELMKLGRAEVRIATAVASKALT